MFKAIGRIGTDKVKFHVSLVPENMTIFTNHAFSFKLQVQRGTQEPHETKLIKCDRSLRNSDIKTVTFPNDPIPIDSTFYIEKGIPQEKIVHISVMKCLPGAKDVSIANGKIDLRSNFGDDFASTTVEMTTTKEGKGSLCKTFTYTAHFSVTKPKHQPLLDQCCQWRKQIQQDGKENVEFKNITNLPIAKSNLSFDPNDSFTPGSKTNSSVEIKKQKSVTFQEPEEFNNVRNTEALALPTT